MRCKQVRKQVAAMFEPVRAPEPIRVTPEIKQHVAACDACRRALEETTALDAAFARLRVETDRSGPSEHVEERVLAELNGAASTLSAPSTLYAPSTLRLWPWLGSSVLACAAILAAVVTMINPWKEPHGARMTPPQAASTPVDEAFTAMPYAIPPAPYERTTVVRTEVPLQTVVAAGFHVHGVDLSASTQADVLYGEDGRILAIRLLSETDDFSPKRMD